MPRKATLSILGMYQYDPTIFDEMLLPEGMDRDTIVNNILMECAELESLFPNPNFLKTAIGLWSKKEMYTWQRVWNASQLEYNPIWNKDGTITDTETRDITNTRNLASSGSTSSTEQVSAFNESTFQNKSQVSGTASGSDTGTVRDAGTISHTIRETGNIGVTTSQQMLKEEYEVSQMNPYSMIVDSFKNRFCLLVY